MKQFSFETTKIISFDMIPPTQCLSKDSSIEVRSFGIQTTKIICIELFLMPPPQGPLFKAGVITFWGSRH